MKKGMELPINMIVIIALAVLILVVITAFTTSQVGSGVSSVSLETAFTSSCSLYRSAGCTAGTWGNNAYKSNVQGAGSLTLQQICQKKNFANEAACQNACGCLAGGGAAGAVGGVGGGGSQPNANQQPANQPEQQGADAGSGLTPITCPPDGHPPTPEGFC